MWCSVALSAVVILLFGTVGRALVWVWWKPRKMERLLRKQGLNGSHYRFFYGDLKERYLLEKEAHSKPMPFSHNVAPRIAPFFHQAAKQYGKLFFTWQGPVPKLFIMDPELVKEIVANKLGHFQKPKIEPPLDHVITGLATLNGEKWAKHRKIVNPAFLQSKLKTMMPQFLASSINLIERWEKLIGNKESIELDIWDELRNLTRDIISRTAFGSSYEEGRHIFELQDEQAHLFVQSSINLIPGFRFLPTKSNLRAKEIHREIKSTLTHIIEKRLKETKLGAHNDNLLAILLQSSITGMHESGNHKDMALTIDDVMDECKIFYFAGQETTSILLTWSLVSLSMDNAWQERAREEVLQVFGKHDPDFDGLNQLKIVNMVLLEVLRLYPSSWLIPRINTKETKLGNFTLPIGMFVGIPVLLIHHDPEYWGEDAHEFNPERFVDGISKASKCDNAYLPFGAGPRICVGKNFALLEAKLALSMILQHFSFKLSPTYAHAPRTILTTVPQYGAKIILKKL